MPEAHRLIGASVGAAVAGGAATLVVGRGGGIEPVRVACLPNADHDSCSERVDGRQHALRPH